MNEFVLLSFIEVAFVVRGIGTFLELSSTSLCVTAAVVISGRVFIYYDWLSSSSISIGTGFSIEALLVLVCMWVRLLALPVLADCETLGV